MDKDITEKKDADNFSESERFYDKVEPESTRDVRRKGAGFDTLGNILRGLKELAFGNGFNIVNRPGRKIDAKAKVQTGLVNVKNMFEMFYNSMSSDGIQGITIGRRGDGEMSNTNLIQIEANHTSSIGTAEGRTNGYIKLRLTRDGVTPTSDRSGVNILDPGSVSNGFVGVAIQVVGQGANGGVVISHITNKADSPTTTVPYILVDKDGIQMLNLPTSNPGGSGRVWKNGTVLNIT